MGVQGCTVLPQLSTLDVEVPKGRNTHPAALGAQSGEQHCCPALICPKCCQLLGWRVLSRASELSRTSYARGKLGLNLVLFRVVIAEAHSPWEIRAVSQPDCSLSCPSCCSLPRSQHFEILQRPASSPATGKMFFLCIFPSSFPSKPLLMSVLLPRAV